MKLIYESPALEMMEISVEAGIADSIKANRNYVNGFYNDKTIEGETDFWS